MAVAGDMKFDAQLDVASGNWYGEYAEFLRLRFAVPSIHLMTFPAACPESVKGDVASASKVMFAVPSAAANRLRTAIETLLTEQGVAQVGLKGKPLSTHARIELLRASSPDAAVALEAVKWIGNSGSHDSEATIDDFMNGADLLSHALRLLYDTRTKELDALAERINRNKGLRPKP